MKKTKVILTLLVLTLILTGCAPPPEDPGENATTEQKIKFILAKSNFNKLGSAVSYKNYQEWNFKTLISYCRNSQLDTAAKEIENTLDIRLDINSGKITKKSLLDAINRLLKSEAE